MQKGSSTVWLLLSTPDSSPSDPQERWTPKTTGQLIGCAAETPPQLRGPAWAGGSAPQRSPFFLIAGWPENIATCRGRSDSLGLGRAFGGTNKTLFLQPCSTTSCVRVRGGGGKWVSLAHTPADFVRAKEENRRGGQETQKPTQRESADSAVGLITGYAGNCRGGGALTTPGGHRETHMVPRGQAVGLGGSSQICPRPAGEPAAPDPDTPPPRDGGADFALPPPFPPSGTLPPPALEGDPENGSLAGSKSTWGVEAINMWAHTEQRESASSTHGGGVRSKLWEGEEGKHPPPRADYWPSFAASLPAPSVKSTEGGPEGAKPSPKFPRTHLLGGETGPSLEVGGNVWGGSGSC